MKIRIEPRALAAAVSAVTRSLPARASVPVLSGALLEAAGETLSVSGFDFETSTQVQAPATVHEPGKVLVSGRLLADIAKALPGKPVDLTCDGSKAIIACGGSRFSLPTMPIEDYPTLPVMPERVGQVPASEFAQAVAQVAIAAGRDDTLPMLTGVHMEITGSRLALATTDRFRLAVRELDWQPDDPTRTGAVLIPARTLAELGKALATAGTIDLALSDKDTMIGVAGAGHRSTTRLLDAAFPKYRQLIPTGSTTTATVNVADLVAVIKRVAIVADRTSQIALTFTAGDGVRVTAGGDDQGSAEEFLPCDIDGDGLTIGFNSSYVLDALAAAGSTRAQFAFTTPNKPAVIRPVDDATGDTVPGLLFLLMPVRQPG